jgi:Na+/proline symporter
MKGYKTFDFFSQLLLIVAVLVCLPFDSAAAVTSISLLSFAGIQILSLIIHAVSWKNENWRSPLRKIHGIGTLVVLVVMIAGLLTPGEDKYDMSGLGIIFYALIPAAAIALLYTYIIYMELKKMKRSN